MIVQLKRLKIVTLINTYLELLLTTVTYSHLMLLQITVTYSYLMLLLITVTYNYRMLLLFEDPNCAGPKFTHLYLFNVMFQTFLGTLLFAAG